MTEFKLLKESLEKLFGDTAGEILTDSAINFKDRDILNEEVKSNIAAEIYDVLVEPNCTIKILTVDSNCGLDFINEMISAIEKNKSLEKIDFSGTTFGYTNLANLVPALQERDSQLPKLEINLSNCVLECSNEQSQNNMKMLKELAEVDLSGHFQEALVDI